MMERAIIFLKQHGYESFELSGVLMIPIDSVDRLEQTVSTIKKLLVQCGYDKSWCVDPHYYERRASLNGAMFEDNKSANIT